MKFVPLLLFRRFVLLGAAKGYEEELLGYTARSRQQSLDRRAGAEREQEKRVHERKMTQKTEGEEGKRSEVKKPPTAPRKRKDK